MLLDFEGNLLADAIAEDRTDGSLLGQPLTERALNGEEGCAFWSYHEEEFLVTASPVAVGESLLGVLVLGQRIDQEFADHVRQATGRDVLICYQEKCLAESKSARSSSSADETQAVLTELRARNAGVEDVVRLEFPGHTTLYSSLKLGDVRIVLSRRLDDFAGLSQRAGGWLLLLGCAILIVAVGVCLGISKRLSQPIAEVVRASQDMAAGNLSTEVSVRGNDELATLSSSFNTMARRIETLVRDLQAAADIAQSASQAKSNFLANISHELRTPLNEIIGFNGLLLEQAESGCNEPSTEQLEWLGTIDSSSQRLLAIVDDILDVARIEKGHLEIELSPCNPRTILDDVIAKFEPAASDDGLTLTLQADSNLPDVISSDEFRLSQLLSNLVENAIKFTKSGSVTVTAEVTHDSPQRLRLTVIDTGIGIPEDRRHAIFEPFVQADGSLTREFGGTGLGLTISRQIAEALGGSLTVSSQVGRGSVFVCEVETGLSGDPGQPDELPDHHDIPTEAAAHSGDKPAESRPSEKEQAPRDEDALEEIRLSGSILVVDDGDANRRLVSLILRKSGAIVAEAVNGQEAIDKFSAEPFDLVVMDMQMPVLDGYEATKELRRRGASIPIIAMTAHAMNGDREKCEAAGCSDYLTKPVTPRDLVTAISNALAGSQDSARDTTGSGSWHMAKNVQ
ncbi:MAG: response regulator [Planctomycetales bacterium]